ncbi:MAG: hypothetical protein HY465_03565 [Deltaproteobacteria bacterium]|nr:hypothetical protein [Deltaproteobacteria bacterium]
MISAGEGINEVVKNSVVACGLSDVECGLYARFVRAAEGSMVDGQGRDAALVAPPPGQTAEYRKSGNDGWRFAVFVGYDRYIAVSRSVHVGDADYVVQVMKRGPAERWGRAEYFFKLFDGKGHEIPRSTLMACEESESSDGFYAEEKTRQLWEQAVYAATGIPFIVHRMPE